MSNNPNFMTKQVAEFNTSQDTLRQIATMEWNVDEMFRVVYNDGLNKNDIPLIKNLYHYLVNIYADRLYSFAWEIHKSHKDPKIKTFSSFEKELRKLYDDWVKRHKDQVPVGLIEKMREYKKWLYVLKQTKLKLGVPMRKESTSEERLDQAMGV